MSAFTVVRWEARMLLRCFCVVVTFLSAIIDAIAENSTNERCGIPTSNNQFPWLVGIEVKGVDERSTITQCTGALINRRSVVSNADCFDVEPRSVRFGPNITINGKICPGENSGDDCKDDGAYRVPIEVVIKHPEFNGNTNWETSGDRYHDIALVRLRDIVHYTEFIRPICLPSNDITKSADTDRELYLAGIYYDVPEAYSQSHLGTEMTFFDKKAIQKTANLAEMASDQISAKHTKEPNLILACMLVGGLLMNKRGDSYELAGLVDTSSNCFSKKLFTHFFLYTDWIRSVTPDWKPCGKRIVEHVELIVNGDSTKAGDWPWHAAIYRLHKSMNTYICGGTLLSKQTILTAAHCVTISGKPVAPETLKIVLGKYYLIGENLESQEIEVHRVIAHEAYAPKNHLENDIALLKLKTEATYTTYVQPVCTWYPEAYDRLPSNKVFGTVVGWGVDQSDGLSSQLKQATIPKVSDSTCIEKKPLFYANALGNHKKFCAGYANGTSPCNGDSGGGYIVFVPDRAKDKSVDAAGSWYIRGIVSLTVSLKNHARCDPYQYVVFTDVEKYADWIKKHSDD